MATYTAKQATPGAAVPGHGMGGDLKVACGSLELGTAVAVNDVLEFLKLPAGAVVVGGWLTGDDIDTNATETFDMDLGWLINDDEAADPDGFGNLGVITGDAVAEIKPEVSIHMWLGGILRTDGPKLFTAETTIAGDVNAVAATGGTGTLTLTVFYFLDPNWAKTSVG